MKQRNNREIEFLKVLDLFVLRLDHPKEDFERKKGKKAGWLVCGVVEAPGF